MSKKIYKQAMSPTRTLYEMVEGTYKSLFDPMLLKVFASLIRPIPIGAKLKLNNGYYGVVVEHNSHDPFKPKLIIAFNEKDEALSSGELQKPFFLDKREDIEIVSWEQEDLRFLHDSKNESQLTQTEKGKLAEDCLPMFEQMYQ